MRFIAAWRFLTVIPFPSKRVPGPDAVGGSLVYFPVIGLILGLILAGLGWVLNLVLPHSVVSIIVVIALVLLTGAFHLDGLADTCDGFGGGTVEERQAIMRDSHTGSFGVAGIVCVLLLEVILLIVIPQPWFLRTLIVMPVVGRWAMVYGITVFPYARPSGLGKIFKENVSRWGFVTATVISLLIAILLLRWAGLLIFVLVAGVSTGLSFFSKRRLGGNTGDTYGAIDEIAEVTVLLLVAILVNKQWLGM